MLFSLLFRIVSSATVLLYPIYASYKTLSRRPASETDIERWLMYWSVLGVIIAIEYIAEWTISWIPFYYFVKTIFLLYLALPQTQGSTYIYTRHLYPFLQAHETEIDKRVVEAKSHFFEWVRVRLRSVWESYGGKIPTSAANATASRGNTPSVDTPPTLLAPMTNPLQLVLGLWHTYSPVVGAFLQQPATPPTAPSSSPRQETHFLSSNQTRKSSATEMHTPIDSNLSNREFLLARRRALEAELAALNTMSDLEPEASVPAIGKTTESSDTGTVASTFAATLASTAFTAMSTYLPTSSATDDRGRYEEIARDELENDDDDSRRVKQTAGRSWWWTSSNSGYERLKTE